MKKILVIALTCMVFGGAVFAKCINEKHQKETETTQEGRRIKTKSYACQVKGSESRYFDESYCRLCGCHRFDHDDT